MNRKRICLFRTAVLTRMCLVMMTLAATLSPSSTAHAQTTAPAGKDAAAEKPTAKSHPNDPMIWDVDRMMEEAVLQISRRYNLTKDQEQYTRLLLIKRVRQFMEQYESEVRELLQESMDMRLGKKVGTPDMLKIWAMRAEPIYAAAKTEILEGNKEWSQILTPEQMKTYERDRSLMESNFSSVTRTLAVWKEGKGVLPFMNKQTATASNKGQVSPKPTPVRNYEPEDNWLAFVNTFVRTYHLDEKQSIAARDKIHKEQFDLAKKYRSQNQTKFEDVRKQLLAKDRSTPVTNLLRRKRELEKPIRELFIAMNDRLNALPSSQQKANVDAEALKQLESMYRSMAAEPPDPARRALKNAGQDHTPAMGTKGSSEDSASTATTAPSDKASPEKESNSTPEKDSAANESDKEPSVR